MGTTGLVSGEGVGCEMKGGGNAGKIVDRLKGGSDKARVRSRRGLKLRFCWRT
jgi:hypothetical protein